jgi:two-component system CheB/CheR fusion protein
MTSRSSVLGLPAHDPTNTTSAGRGARGSSLSEPVKPAAAEPATPIAASARRRRSSPQLEQELETAKEELQAINDKLTAANRELESRHHEMVRANRDLENLLSAVDVPILILDAERRIRRFTPKARRILNVVAADIGRPLSDIRSSLDAPALDAHIRDVLETRAIRESEVQDRDGHWYRLQIRPYETTDQQIEGTILSLFDIDALKRSIAEAQRARSDSERANHTKDEFLATLSHELRTPLSSMLMRAQLLRHGVIDEAKVRRAGEAIEAGVKLQVQLIDDLLDVSRIVAGKLRMNLRPINLAQVIMTAIDGLRLAAMRKTINLEVDVAEGDRTRRVIGDDARLQQVVTNLLTNAIKFTPERGTVTVSLTFGADAAVLRVADTGMGIAPEFLPNVFDRFAQQGDRSTRAHGGLGLGLAIVRHLVELHHGTVEARSPGTNRGATFSVTLPVTGGGRATPFPDSLRVPNSTPIDFAPLTGLRVLVVDDDRATREAVADMLGRTGAEVRLAAASAEALRVVQDFRPEVLLCDIAMPGEDGYAFLRRLRALDVADFSTIPAAAFTALAREEDRERALAAGFQMHIAKPVDCDQLAEAVLQLVARRAVPERGER